MDEELLQWAAGGGRAELVAGRARGGKARGGKSGISRMGFGASKFYVCVRCNAYTFYSLSSVVSVVYKYKRES